MRKLLKYLSDYKKECVFGPLFKLLEASFELFVPLVVAAIIDKGIAEGDYGYIARMCLILVILGIVGLICSISAQYFAAKAAVGFSAKLRAALFKHITSLSYTELDTLGAPTLITRMSSDINQLQSGVNLTLRLFLRSPFVVFGAMIMAFTVDFDCALIFAAAIPVLAVVVFGIMLITMPMYKRLQKLLDRLTTKTRDNITGVRVIRAFTAEERETEEFTEMNDVLTNAQKVVGRISALLNPLTYVIINLAVIWLIQKGAFRVEIGLLTQGKVVALYNYMSQILVELIKLANMIISISRAVACGRRISDIMDTKCSMEYGTVTDGKTDMPAVEFRSVSMRYKGSGAESVADISFKALRGEKIGIIGGTGSGKTTLVNLIPRFYDASSGEVIVDGVNVREYEKGALVDKIGVVPQSAALFKGTIRSNVSFGTECSDPDIINAIEIAQAKELINEKGLDHKIEQGGTNLSGGQRQRLTIARALIRKPEILILDDSASALDPATDAALSKAIMELPFSPTVFVVSQRAASVMDADKIIVLDGGIAAGIGTHAELLQSCEVYREIYYSQFPKENGHEE